jgi:hypothetical protein
MNFVQGFIALLPPLAVRTVALRPIRPLPRPADDARVACIKICCASAIIFSVAPASMSVN